VNHDDDLERLLAGALQREADQIDAAPGDYQRLQQRITAERLTRSSTAWLPWLATAAAVATVIAVSGAWLAGRPDPSGIAGPAADATSQLEFSATSTPTATLRAAPTATLTATTTATTSGGSTATSVTAALPSTWQALRLAAASPHALPVYWVAPGDRPGWVLYREWYAAPVVGPQQAVDAMLGGHPADPDYGGPWRPAAARVTVTEDAIVVDVARAAFGNTDVHGELARAGIQQLLYTVTGAAEMTSKGAGRLPVRLLVDGKPGATVWGLTLVPELHRDPAAQANVWILSPGEGTRLKPGAVTVKVWGTAFEANVVWVVYRVDGKKETEVDSSYTMVGSMGERAGGQFTVRLKAGQYRIRVYEPDMSDGEAPTNPDVPEDQTGDDKTVVVR
jgi:hypothetical protein